MWHGVVPIAWVHECFCFLLLLNVCCFIFELLVHTTFCVGKGHGCVNMVVVVVLLGLPPSPVLPKATGKFGAPCFVKKSVS